ncbi:hypothetical protein ONZ51_g3238 [Trametes cubensis]|uniref:THO1-MOS11 C-terminal domain-containing protein n=1 Tax=Trametes cubensis TaxID=1111947 RepID=A0AAD7U0K6_9APHY|nr:hypothetical protein ONZ51_g3238 [Trametes cubensis]
MDAKLKALKVVELKDILNKAGVAIPSKANKQDLIAKIIASPAAVDVYNQQHGPAPTEAAPNASKPASKAQQNSEVPPPAPTPAAAEPTKPSKPASTAKPSPATKPASQAAPKQSDAPTSPPKEQTASSTTSAQPSADEEAEKRKARAARFGIPVVEPKAAPAQKNGKAASNGKPAKTAAALGEDAEKLAARAARFGTQVASTEAAKSNGTANGKKRSAPPSEHVDEEELARRKKRAERFGIPLVGASA